MALGDLRVNGSEFVPKVLPKKMDAGISIKAYLLYSVFMAILLAVFFSLNGCASVSGWFQEENILEQAVTEGNVVEYLAHNPGMADEFLSVSTDAIEYLGTGKITVAQLETFVVDRLEGSVHLMTAEGRAGLHTLVVLIKGKLTKRLKISDPNGYAIVASTFMTWVRNGTVAYMKTK